MGGGEARRSRRVGVLAGLLVLLTATAAVAATRWSSDAADPTFCAGVGLVSTDRHPTAEAAFAAWLADNHSEPPRSEWRSDGESRRPRTGIRAKEFSTTESPRYWRVSAWNGGTDDDGSLVAVDGWEITGGCVRPPP